MQMRDPLKRRRMKRIDRDLMRFVAALAVVFLVIVVIGSSGLAIANVAGVNVVGLLGDPADHVAGGRLERVYDAEAGVVCWMVNTMDSQGVSCLPISDTKLEEGDIR